MTKRAPAKYKIDRRIGENIWGRPKSPGQPPRIRPRPARPAPQGQAVRLRRAAARQAEAQGLLRQHLREAVPAYYEKPSAAAATPRENLIGLLERRLDAIVYRAKFVPTVFAARQFVNHGHVQGERQAARTSRATAASRAT
jgi:small subunit ribosomal protein S4